MQTQMKVVFSYKKVRNSASLIGRSMTYRILELCVDFGNSCPHFIELREHVLGRRSLATHHAGELKDVGTTE